MDKLFLYLTSLSPHTSYFIVFGILVACGLGFPFPEDIPLIAAGYLVWEGTMSWFPAFTITMAGVLIGDTILFFLGRQLGLRFLHPHKKGARPMFKPEQVRRVRAYFRKYGDKLVFFARFVAGFRAACFFMAGAMKMPYKKFIFLDGLAALVSVPVWIAIGWALGYYLGDEISQIMKSIKEVKTALTVVTLIIVVTVSLRIYAKYRLAKKVPGSRRIASS